LTRRAFGAEQIGSGTTQIDPRSACYAIENFLHRRPGNFPFENVLQIICKSLTALFRAPNQFTVEPRGNVTHLYHLAHGLEHITCAAHVQRRLISR
jgi:hypothetical protein